MAADDATATLEPVNNEAQQREGVNDEPDEGVEYEAEFETPFGKIELEFEPRTRKEKKDAARREKAQRDAEQAAARAEAEAARKAARRAERAARTAGRGHRLLIVLLVVAIVGAAIAVAWWLFANPEEGEEDLGGVPPELREAEERVAAESQGALARVRARVREAVRAGRHASREAQQREQSRYEELVGR
jgi:hypothetical protein